MSVLKSCLSDVLGDCDLFVEDTMFKYLVSSICNIKLVWLILKLLCNVEVQKLIHTQIPCHMLRLLACKTDVAMNLWSTSILEKPKFTLNCLLP